MLENERVAAVQRYEILDTAREGAFDRITRLAAQAFSVPFAAISIVDRNRTWFKSVFGFTGLQEIPREDSPCSSAITGGEAYIVEDAPEHVRLRCQGYVTGTLGLRFYVGMPLVSSDGDKLGVLCDSYGHSAGDLLIVRIAEGLHSRVRVSDVLARLGGDEFAILLPGADVEATHTAAEGLLQIVRDQSAPLTGVQIRVTASIGVARFDDLEDLTADEIMVNADVAMYDAKRAGRDRYARYRAAQHGALKSESSLRWTRKVSDPA